MLLQFSKKLHLAKQSVWEGAKCLLRGVVLPQRAVGKALGPLGCCRPGVRPRAGSLGTAGSSLNPNTVSKCHLVATGNKNEEP